MRLRGRPSFVVGPARVALLPPAAFAVHQLRYEIAYGSRAGVELHETGHSYLHSAVPWLVLLIGLAVGGFLRHLGQAYARRSSPRAFTLSFSAAWALCAGALIVIFFCQETLEGWFAAGHPSGLPAAFGDGGWWAVPVAVGVGLILAAVFHGTSWIVSAVGRCRQPAAVSWGAAPALRLRASDRPTVLGAPWLGGWSSRGPPRTELATNLVASL